MRHTSSCCIMIMLAVKYMLFYSHVTWYNKNLRHCM